MAAIRLLMVEDNEDDAVLVSDALRCEEIDVSVERVEAPESMAAALRGLPPDLVICDYRLPGFSAEEALSLVRDSGLDIPFILVSGYIGEDAAVEMMRSGAHDFIPKDTLHRLAPAVRRELQQADSRRQRRDAEEALRTSEAHYRLLAEHAQDLIFRCQRHPHAELAYLSASTAAVTGYPEAQLLGPPHRVFDHIIDASERERFEQSWRTGNDTSLIVRWRRLDGSTAWLEQRASPVHEAGQLVAVEGTLRDITERVLAEREREMLIHRLEQTERVESLAVLAGGVAHDFNNALAVILTSAAFLCEDLDEQHPCRTDVDRIINAANRSAALTKKLLLFARREATQPEVIDLNACLADLEDLIRRMIGEDIEVTYALSAGPSPAKIDRNQIEQVVLNLVANSRAAMPTGGRLRIESAPVTVTATEDINVPAGLYVRTSITDTGDGMSPEVLKHAFDPFFTTKGPGEGTGLGLSTAHGVAQQAGGGIVLRSAPGEGTTVDLYLPASAREADVGTSTEPNPPQDGNAETILLVEDEDPVRDVVSRILLRHRYDVIAVASAEEALRVCARAEARVDLLLTDLIMPGLSGVQLVDRLRERRPDLPVVYMSGYTADHLPGTQAAGPAIALLRKPFNAASLLTHLREALDNRHTRPATSGSPLPPASTRRQ